MVEDDKSIYVGGIPYDSTEDMLRDVFDVYGAVTTVKIINNKNVVGKCFAFVTFSNPRSAQEAIMDMNQRTIGGRVVHVNEVRTRNTNNHENFRHGTSYDRERGRERSSYPYQYNNRYRERSASLSRDRERNRERSTSLSPDRERKRESSSDVERERERKRERSVDRFSDRDANEDYNKPQDGQLKEGRESGENDDHLNELRIALKKRIEKHDDIQRKVDLFKDKIDKKRLDISEIQKKSKKLEHRLISTQKNTSERKMLLNKFHRSFVQFMSYTEKIKVSQKELEELANEATDEIDKEESIAPFINGQF